MTVDEAISIIGCAAVEEAYGRMTPEAYLDRSRAAIQVLLAEERERAAERAVEWYKRGQCIPIGVTDTYTTRQLRAAIAPEEG